MSGLSNVSYRRKVIPYGSLGGVFLPMKQANISTLVDQTKLGAVQWTIYILCGLCLIMDGFDVQAMGYVAPAVIKEFGVSGALMGQVLSAALVGIFLPIGLAEGRF